MGRLFLSKPHGIEMAGNPARLTEMVYISERYIAIGSSSSPILFAVLGATGDKLRIRVDTTGVLDQTISFFLKGLVVSNLENRNVIHLDTV